MLLRHLERNAPTPTTKPNSTGSSDLAGVGAVSWRATECLGPCDHANVLVVYPAPTARAAGSRPIWLGRLDHHHLESLTSWIAAGGPGLATLPPDLHPLVLPGRGQHPA